MENDPATPDSPQQNTPSPTARDPLIRYSVFAALGCAGLCMIFTILYIFSYSLDSTLSFERHFDSYIASGNSNNLATVLGLHMAQNRMFLQSCGMVAGIFFAFLGLALFLVGIQGSVDATGKVTDYSTSLRRVAPGGVILLASMIFVGVSAMHPIELMLSPTGSPAAAAAEQMPAQMPAQTPGQTPAQPQAQPSTYAAPPPSAQPAATQSQVLTAPRPATQAQAAPTLTAHLALQSATLSSARPAPQLTPQQPTPQQSASQQAAPQQTAPQPALAPAQPPTTSRPVPFNQSSAVSPLRMPPTHHFQP